MRYIENAISDELFTEIKNDLESKQETPCWMFAVGWEAKLQKGLSNHIHSAIVSEDIHQKLVEALSVHCEFKTPLMQYYIWPQGSSIAWHDDGGYALGATLYLNKIWDWHYGGIFLYQERQTNKTLAILPTHKSLIINDLKEQHMVTNVDPKAPTYRVSIQIWELG